MKQVPSNKLGLLVSVMSDPAFQNTLETIYVNALFKENQSDILAARGFIAYGLLFHGLEKRYRVNYGLNTATDAKTKMAVPYSASDTAKPRAQYSHPDMELVYSALSYFHSGLTEPQLKAALEHLQTLGPMAQETIYGEWVNSVRIDLDPEVLSKFDHILKVDVNNKLQLDLIHEKLGRCMEAISFWTSHFVYRTETSQFPSKRATSAWNLSDSGQAIGFSGTDDNRHLLPRSICQIDPAEEELRATNGCMIRRILDCTLKVHLLDDAGNSFPMWQHVLTTCVSLEVHALIDAAGLMAGSRNDEAAVYLSEGLTKAHANFRGVVYFNTKSEAWYVYEMEHRRKLPLQRSSLTEAECITYFDESRCRGSDLRLLGNAVGLVTLEPKMTKDKFLQSCARLRKLGAGTDSQSLILAGTSEVVSRSSTVKQVLEQIVHNTASMTRKGLLLYYQHGLNYASFPNPIDDDITLKGMYAHHVPAYTDLNTFLDATNENEAVSDNVKELIVYCKSVGQGSAIDSSTGQLSQECEQELEEECNEEEFEEREIPKQEPAAQEDWSYAEAFSHPENLFRTLFIPLKHLIDTKLQCLSVISWSDNIYCTPNFWKTIQAADSCADLSCYLRPVNAMLVMPSADTSVLNRVVFNRVAYNRVVLISSYELDKLLPVWWSTSSQNPKVILQHLFTTNVGRCFGKESLAIPDEVLTFVKLFRGYVQYSEPQREVLSKILRRVPESYLVVQELLCMRGRLGFFNRSDLEAISSMLHL
jgi:hypothetical protein